MTSKRQRTLEEARERLQADRVRLLERVRGLDDTVHHREEPLPQDFAEQAVELENQEVMEALDEDARAELRRIDQALARIEDDSYGECARCGNDINLERLAALPSATTCIDCASAAEA
ncbi:MAG TPA: TraR/DksA family transcriptional regulator [Pseudomonadales bacterium]|nr:TraR/DksA family transcriptional regulator [Pseudomonadales bacterium]